MKDVMGMIENLRRMAAERGHMFHVEIDEASEREREQLQFTKAQRASRLRGAGAPVIDQVVNAIGSCPWLESAPWTFELALGAEAILRSEIATLVLSASTGRGKSFAASWAVAEVRGSAFWLPASDCRVAGWDEVRAKALKANLLVVDDLGEESSGDWGIREMATLLESRHNGKKKTIVTTNLLPEAIEKRYGERLGSRWSDVRSTRFVAVRGADLRRGR